MSGLGRLRNLEYLCLQNISTPINGLVKACQGIKLKTLEIQTLSLNALEKVRELMQDINSSQASPLQSLVINHYLRDEELSGSFKAELRQLQNLFMKKHERQCVLRFIDE